MTEKLSKRGYLHFIAGEQDYVIVQDHEDPTAQFSITFDEIDELKAFKDRLVSNRARRRPGGRDHDFITCEWEDCPECEEARSQSTCDECGGAVIDVEGTWYHEPWCSEAERP